MRLTPAENKRVKQCAEAAGLTRSEWCRQVLLHTLDAPLETRLVLSELLALRMIVLRLQLDLIEGEQPTMERMKEILERADATKYTLAEQRIRALQSQAALSINSDPAEGSAG